jgi:hypothetical protein
MKIYIAIINLAIFSLGSCTSMHKKKEDFSIFYDKLFNERDSIIAKNSRFTFIERINLYEITIKGSFSILFKLEPNYNYTIEKLNVNDSTLTQQDVISKVNAMLLFCSKYDIKAFDYNSDELFVYFDFTNINSLPNYSCKLEKSTQRSYERGVIIFNATKKHQEIYDGCVPIKISDRSYFYKINLNW